MADQDFKIVITSTADTTGFKDATASQRDLTGATGKTVEATDLLTKAGEKGAESTKNLTVKNNDLEKILRVVGRISPETGAALAGIGAVGGAGVGIGIFAMEQLVRVMIDAEVQAEKVKASAREAFVTLKDQAESAESTVRNATQAIDDFWTALNRKSAQGSVSSAFGSELQQLQSIAKALGIDSTVAEAGLKNERAAQLESSVAALTKELENIKARMESPEAKENELELQKLKADKTKLAEAYKTGEYFKPTAGSASPGGILGSRILTDEVNEARRKQNFENLDKVITDQILQREQLKKNTSDQVGLVQDTIDRMTGEAADLRTDAGRQITGGRISSAGAALKANAVALGSGDVSAMQQQLVSSQAAARAVLNEAKKAAAEHSGTARAMAEVFQKLAQSNRELAAQVRAASRFK